MKARRSDSRLSRNRRFDVALVADPRSAAYPVAPLLQAEAPLVSRRWHCGYSLDQGSEGACVGFGTAHWYGADPWPQEVTNRLARKLYKGAQQYDEWRGDNYEGTTVTGMMRYLTAMGFIGGFRWCESFDDLCRTLSQLGPVIVGMEWREGCREPDLYGQLHFNGRISGGHCVCVDEIDLARRRIWLKNSWGDAWGIDGRGWFTFEDWRRILKSGPQIAVPIERELNLKLEARPWWRRIFG